jgi:uncharacterized protein YndB with AHSA1/START domain
MTEWEETPMYTAAIEREIQIDAPIDVVWDVITKPEHISNWFSDETVLDLRPGGEGSLHFKEMGHVAPFSVETVDPPHAFSFRWSYPDGEQALTSNSMLVEFFLTTVGQATVLRLVERGFDDVDWSEEKKSEYFNDHNQGWDEIVPRLPIYVMTIVGPDSK